ncbi:hypothetical protein HOLleu_02498 [Holothuria leucospilota]|uniref:Uncharacterized protein n=1 Tax=Holothuria leucospilota TaxID=206669 RepID=A0A9Q1CRQ5_HOLLE|nr:hypothetical protein HOLleu_02498 [Holothuria leucospilota]
MDDAEMASLVEALTPRVVEACRNQLSNNHQSSVATHSTSRQFDSIQPSTQLSNSHQLPVATPSTSRQFDSNGPSTSHTGRSSTSRPLTIQPPTSRLSAIWPVTSRQSCSNVQRSTPREELRRSFATKRNKQVFTPYRKKEVGSKCMDVVLLPHHT